MNILCRAIRIPNPASICTLPMYMMTENYLYCIVLPCFIFRKSYDSIINDKIRYVFFNISVFCIYVLKCLIMTIIVSISQICLHVIFLGLITLFYIYIIVNNIVKVFFKNCWNSIFKH